MLHEPILPFDGRTKVKELFAERSKDDLLILTTDDEGSPRSFLFRDKEGGVSFGGGGTSFPMGELGLQELWDALCWTENKTSRV